MKLITSKINLERLSKGGKIMSNEVSTQKHYEQLITEGTDFYRDPPLLQKYMNRWTGEKFIDFMELDNSKDVLEVGVGTGRIAQRVLDKGYKSFIGIDISPRTLKRAEQNLSKYKNIELIQQDILNYKCQNRFDVVYSVLTFIHIENKELAIKNIVSSLTENGVAIISFDNNKDSYLEYGNRKVKLFSVDIDLVISYFKECGCIINNVLDLFDDNTTEKSKVATIIKVTKTVSN